MCKLFWSLLLGLFIIIAIVVGRSMIRTESFMCGASKPEHDKNIRICLKENEATMCPPTLSPERKRKCLKIARKCTFPGSCHKKFRAGNTSDVNIARVEGSFDTLNCQTLCDSINDCCYLKNPMLFKTEEHLLKHN